ncbi:hypothetical protein O6H91_03G013900 [Diphasiastrum complanatum]|uniref:Uncharacterized protein n=1 Tax=Diphasiastrum complanatum TaxID=34168 RepID=A0ACC2E3W0_DIPCM|nr:hypothetical protein O6H91_03G013900 [Diphasiastrum complanatum]
MMASPRESLDSSTTKRMIIHVAESGHSYELDCVPMTSVEIVQNFLASLTGLPQQHQLLIVGEVRLEPQRVLAAYQLPAENRPVFLFNKQRLSPDSPAPIPEVSVRIAEAVLPPVPSDFHSDHPLDEASDPALRALPSYERQFKYHFQKGQAILLVSQRKFDACRRLLREQQVQQLAIDTARGNMDHYYRLIVQSVEEFMKHFSQQHHQHSKLLRNLERDLQRLRACKLHPVLQTPSRKTLIDCIEEPNLRHCEHECSISHKQFHAKVSQLKIAFDNLQSSMDELFSASAVDIPHVEDTIQKHSCLTEEQASIIQSLSKDVDTVRKLIDDCVGRQLSASLRPHDAVSALGPMYEVHAKNHLPRIEACDQELGKLLMFCEKSKNKMSLSVYKRLQSIAVLQSNIRDMRNQLSGFKEAMGHQDDIFAKLKSVRKVGAAYRACLAEAVRRKACMKLYMGQAVQLAEKLAKKREVELARRKEFFAVQSAYIPHDLLLAMGLLDVPSQCVVSIAPYDTNLLDVDVVDVDRYAPDSLVGPSSHFTGFDMSHATHSSSSSTSQGIEIIEHSDNANSNEGIGFEIGDEKSYEIVGTSKLEVENARLKAELASAIAMLCNLDPSIEPGLVGSENQSFELDEHTRTMNATKRTMEALRLKDEHAKHLHSILVKSRTQCKAYERRIRELEQILQNQHRQVQNLRTGIDPEEPSLKPNTPECKAEIVGESDPSAATGLELASVGQVNVVTMDEGLSGLPQQIQRLGNNDEPADEGEDEFMSELTAGVSDANQHMLEVDKNEQDADADAAVEAIATNQAQMEGENCACHGEGEVKPSEMEGAAVREGSTSVLEESNQILALQSALLEKSRLCDLAEDQTKTVSAELLRLGRELESNTDLLRECQMNCAHLENRLHEAREEARANLCAADHRAAEYNALRTSSVKLRGFMERLRACISAPVGEAIGFAESLKALSTSLASSSMNEDVSLGFSDSLRVLAERVGELVQQRARLLERCTKAEAAQCHLSKELESKIDMLKSLYTKRKLEKQNRYRGRRQRYM